MIKAKCKKDYLFLINKDEVVEVFDINSNFTYLIPSQYPNDIESINNDIFKHYFEIVKENLKC